MLIIIIIIIIIMQVMKSNNNNNNNNNYNITPPYFSLPVIRGNLQPPQKDLPIGH